MAKITLLLLLLFFFGNLKAQNDSTKIEIAKSLGTIYKLDGKVLKPKDILQVTSSNPKAYEQMQIAKTNGDVGGVLGFIGGFMLGFGVLGPAISGKEISSELAIAGGAFTLGSIPFSVGFAKRTKKAVEIYNGDLQTANLVKYKCNFAFTGSAFGLKVSF